MSRWTGQDSFAPQSSRLVGLAQGPVDTVENSSCRALCSGHIRQVASEHTSSLTPWKTPDHLENTAWHAVDIGPVHELWCFIEIPRGSKYKYEMHKPTGIVMVDRVLHSAVHYPANYGFIPRTFCDDNDPLDVLVLGQQEVGPSVLMRGRPIGVMTMHDNQERDDKIIAVHANDPEYNHYQDISELPGHKTRELERFFTDYKALEYEGRRVEIDRFSGAEAARRIIHDAVELYITTYVNRKQ